MKHCCLSIGSILMALGTLEWSECLSSSFVSPYIGALHFMFGAVFVIIYGLLQKQDQHDKQELIATCETLKREATSYRFKTDSTIKQIVAQLNTDTHDIESLTESMAIIVKNTSKVEIINEEEGNNDGTEN